MINDLLKIMDPYFKNRDHNDTNFLNEVRDISLENTGEVPLKAKRTEWQIEPEPNRLIRNFEFKNLDRLRTFLNELLIFQNETGHDATITLPSKGLYVNIEVFTHDVNDITELDTEYAKMADMIYIDTLDLLDKEEWDDG